MGLNGTIDIMPATYLFKWADLYKPSGTLIFKSSLSEWSMKLINGNVISTSSNNPKDYLGQVLINKGYINEAQLKKAFEVQKETRVKIGKVLVMAGEVTDSQIDESLREKMAQTVFDILLLDEGEFEFVKAEQSSISYVELELSIQDLVRESQKKIIHFQKYREMFPPNMVLYIKNPEVLDEYSPESIEKQILIGLQERLSFQDIAFKTKLSEYYLLEKLYELYQDKAIRIDREEMEHAGIKDIIAKAERLILEGKYVQAGNQLKVVLDMEPRNALAIELLKKIAQELQSCLKNDFFDSIPSLNFDLKQMGSYNFTPVERDIISKINNKWTISEIIEVSPFKFEYAISIFQDLVSRQVIVLRRSDSEDPA